MFAENRKDCVWPFEADWVSYIRLFVVIKMFSVFAAL